MPSGLCAARSDRPAARRRSLRGAVLAAACRGGGGRDGRAWPCSGAWEWAGFAGLQASGRSGLLRGRHRRGRGWLAGAYTHGAARCASSCWATGCLVAGGAASGSPLAPSVAAPRAAAVPGLLVLVPAGVGLARLRALEPRRPAAAAVPARADRGGRHRRLFRRPALRPAQARAAREPRQDLGGLRAAACVAWRPSRSCRGALLAIQLDLPWLVAAAAVALVSVVGDLVREHVQASRGRQGQRRAAAGPRRRARPHRQPDARLRPVFLLGLQLIGVAP